MDMPIDRRVGGLIVEMVSQRRPPWVPPLPYPDINPSANA